MLLSADFCKLIALEIDGDTVVRNRTLIPDLMGLISNFLGPIFNLRFETFCVILKLVLVLRDFEKKLTAVC